MILTIISVWFLVGLAAWIFMIWAVNRRYRIYVDSWGMLLFMLFFIVIGPLAWFPAFVIKGLNESE